VFIFVGLTACDTQEIKRIGQGGFAAGEIRQKAAILGTLTLYLDLTNLFFDATADHGQPPLTLSAAACIAACQ
jgi:FtsH-binding integral membrane protein